MAETSKVHDQHDKIRQAMRAERISYREVSESSREELLNNGLGYTSQSVRSLLLEHRAQPQLQALIVRMVDERKQRKVDFLKSEIIRLEKERDALNEINLGLIAEMAE